MLNKLKRQAYIFLKYTEKWTNTDMVYLAKGSFWLTIGQGASLIANLALSVAFANFLSQETYGFYKFILSMVGLLSIFGLSGMQTALIRAIANNADGTLIAGVKIRIKWGVLGGISSLGLGLYYFLQGNNTLSLVFVAVSVFMPFYGVFESYMAYFMGKKRFDRSTTFTIISHFAIAAIMIGTLYFTNNIFIIIIAYFAGRLLVNSALFFYTIAKYGLNDKVDEATLSFGKHLSVMGVIEIIAEQIDKILIWNNLGAAQLAVYSFALLPVDNMKAMALKNVSTLAFPKFAGSTLRDLKKTLPGKIIKYTIFTSAAAAAYYFSAPYIYELFFPQYTGSVPYSRILVIGLAILPISLLNTVLISQNDKKTLYFLSFSSNALKIILFLILLPLYKVYGMVCALLAVQVFNSSVLIYYFVKRTK